MRTLVHLSDLHFGRIHAPLLQPLTDFINRLEPDLVAVSGDLTQRAKPAQFAEAKQWLAGLTAPRLVVPGNHDVPLYRVWERFLSPLGAYRSHFDENVEPDFVDEEMAVIGINSARSLTFKGGRINEQQLERLRARLSPLPRHLLRVVVTHHPFSLPEHADEDDLIGRARLAMATFHELGVDLLLAGHMHTSLASSTAQRYPIDGYAALVIQAGTATSTRGRGEENSFNVLRLQHDRVEVERHAWREQELDFRPVERFAYARVGEAWHERRPV